MQADKTCKFNSYTMLIVLVLVFGLPIVACIVFCVVNYFKSKNEKIERRELMNSPNKYDKPLDTKNMGQTAIPLENALDKAAPTASPYYFSNPENANIQVARPMNVGINIGEPVYDEQRAQAEKSRVEPYIPVTQSRWQQPEITP